MVKQNEKRGLITKTFSSLSFKHDPFSLPWLRRTNVLSKYYPHRPPEFNVFAVSWEYGNACPRCGSKNTMIYMTLPEHEYFAYCHDCHFYGLPRKTETNAKRAWRYWKGRLVIS